MDELSDLYKNSKIGNFLNLQNLLQKKQYSQNDLDIGFRILLSNYNSEKEDYYNSFKLYIKYINVNYQNPREENNTIIFHALKLKLIPQALKLISYFKYLENEKKLNINICDNDGNNILFLIISNNYFKSEDERYELFDETISEGPNISHVNKEGHNLLTLCALYGRVNILKVLINLNYNIKHIVSSTGDNALHCAVKSGNLLCISSLINYFFDSLDAKNKDGETALNISKRLKYRDIEEYLNNVIKINSQNNLTNNNETEKVDFLTEYKNKNYTKILSKFISEPFSSDAENISLKWNKLLVEFKYEQNRININTQSPKSISQSYYSNFLDFFEKYKLKLETGFPIINLNRMILKNKLGNYEELEELFTDYKKFYINYKENDTILFNYWLCYLNINLILLEYNLSIKKFIKSSSIISRIEVFIDETKDSFNDSSYMRNESLISYLNLNGTINPSNNIMEILYFYKCIKFLGEGNIKKFEELNKNSKNISSNIKNMDKEKVPIIIKKSKNYFKYLKIKLMYIQNENDLMIKKLEELKNENVNNINSSSLEELIFYYNTIGILNLKNNKLIYAEFCFKKCKELIYNQNNSENLVLSIANIMPIIWYNLGLTYFYLNNYKKCKKIFTYLKYIQKFKSNPCLYYRLGCSYLELEMEYLKTNSEGANNYKNDLISRIEYLDNGNNKNDSENIDSNDICSKEKYNNQNEESVSKSLMQSNTITIHNKKGIIILRSKESKEEEIISNFNEAINNFKQCIYLINADYMNTKEPIPKYLLRIFNSTYIKLLFTYSLLESWNEVLFYCTEFRKSKFYLKENEQNLTNLVTLSYINLNLIDNALRIIKQEINNLSIHHDENFNSIRKNCYSDIVRKVYNNINYKIGLYINFIKIYKKNNSKKDGENNEIELPLYFINVIVYYLLVTDKKIEALELIKYRKIPESLLK